MRRVKLFAFQTMQSAEQSRSETYVNCSSVYLHLFAAILRSHALARIARRRRFSVNMTPDCRSLDETTHRRVVIALISCKRDSM